MARIISGLARNTKLQLPEGMNTRPTGERIKEAIFSALQFELAGKSFLDLYAGSGQIGLEAASRGAKVILIEPQRAAVQCIKHNIRKCNCDLDVQLFTTRDQIAVSKLLNQGQVFDFIYCDPPWQYLSNTLLHPLVQNNLAGLLTVTGRLFLELPSKQDNIELPNLQRQREYTYGNTRICEYVRLD